MKMNINTIEEIWKSQSFAEPDVPVEKLLRNRVQHTRRVKAKHIGTLVTLSVLMVILLSYFFLTSAYSHTWMFLGVGGMIASVFARTFIEWISYRRLQRISPEIPSLMYCNAIIRFYEWRKRIHYILTPFLYLVYAGSFCLLLLPMRALLPHGLYMYILISTIPVFLLLGIYIAWEIKKEMNYLGYLTRLTQEL